MNVLLLRANPRKTGYTQRLTDWFLQGLRTTHANVNDIDVTSLRITPCHGCFHCWLETPGQCVHHDDMPAQLELILNSNVIVCATPIYYYSMNSSLKAYFERTFPLAQPGLQASARGLTRNRLRYPDRWHGKKLITLVTGALREPEAYRPANEIFQLIADSMDLEIGGQLTRPESSLLDFALSKPKTLKKIEMAFIQAGQEAGTTGSISPKTLEAAAAPLSADAEHFRTYSNIYWEHACALGSRRFSLAEVQKRVVFDVRILMQEMVRCFNPQAARRLKAVIQFNFPDQDLHFCITLDRGHCELKQVNCADPDLRIRCLAETWAAVFMRLLDVREALLDRRLFLEGDKSLFTQLDKLFPPLLLEEGD